MGYSQEKIYLKLGQFDTTVIVYFKPNSESIVKYGDNIVGNFYYTSFDRLELENNKNQDFSKETLGKVKFQSTSSSLSYEQTKELQNIGIEISDISLITPVEFPDKNNYVLKEQRELPFKKKITISFNAEDVDEDMATLYFLNRRLELGYKLTPIEMYRYYASHFTIFGEYPQEHLTAFFIDITENIADEIQYFYLKNLSKKVILNEEQTIKLSQIWTARSNRNIEIITKELIRYENTSLKTFAQSNIKGFKLLVELAKFFGNDRLSNTKVPIWWDFERFIHILCRHVKEIKQNIIYKDKDNFPYAIRDIRPLIENVLKLVANDIDYHFANTPTNNFVRKKTASIYYNGDYFELDVEANTGRLMTFYKRKI